jgi:hypothetical protein
VCIFGGAWVKRCGADFWKRWARRHCFVFCAHLVIVLVALAATGDKQGNSLWESRALLGGSFVILYAIARMYGDRLTDGRRAQRTCGAMIVFHNA